MQYVSFSFLLSLICASAVFAQTGSINESLYDREEACVEHRQDVCARKQSGELNPGQGFQWIMCSNEAVSDCREIYDSKRDKSVRQQLDDMFDRVANQ